MDVNQKGIEGEGYNNVEIVNGRHTEQQKNNILRIPYGISHKYFKVESELMCYYYRQFYVTFVYR